MSRSHDPAPGWRKSSLSTGGECVEVKFADGEVQVRHSRNPLGPSLTFSQMEWAAFIRGVRNDEFDVPVSRHTH